MAAPTRQPRRGGLDRTDIPRLPDGQLAGLILAHLRTHPTADFSPYELSKVLHRSHGAIRTRLLALVAAGQVTRTQTSPARFQHHS